MKNYFFAAALLLGFCQAGPATALESRPLPPPMSVAPASGPAVSAPGPVILDEVWLQSGGARLYQNTLVVPRQIRMGGASFVDPAAVPELSLQPAQATAKRRTVRRSSVQAAKMPAKQSTPPPGIGSTKLSKPQAAGSAVSATGASAATGIAPLSAASPAVKTGGDAAPKAAGTAPVSAIGTPAALPARAVSPGPSLYDGSAPAAVSATNPPVNAAATSASLSAGSMPGSPANSTASASVSPPIPRLPVQTPGTAVRPAP